MITWARVFRVNDLGGGSTVGVKWNP